MAVTGITLGQTSPTALRQSYYLTGGLAIPTSGLLFGQSFLGSDTLSATGFQMSGVSTEQVARTGESLKSVTLLLNFRFNGTPTNYRIFGSDDPRGGNHEVRTFGHTGYSANRLSGGTVLTINTADFPPDVWSRVAFVLGQEGPDVHFKIFKDGGVLYADAILNYALDHSSTEIEFLAWSGAFENAALREAVVVRGALSDAECHVWSSRPSDFVAS